MIQKPGTEDIRNIYLYIVDRGGAVKIISDQWVAWGGDNQDEGYWVFLNDGNNNWENIYSEDQYKKYNLPYPLTDLSWERLYDTETKSA